MTKLTPSARAFLDEAKGGDEPTSAARARVRAKLLARIGAGAATGAAAGSATAAGAATKATLSTGLLLKVLGVLAVTGAIAAGTQVMRRGSEPAKPAASALATTAPSLEADRSSPAREAPAATDKPAEARASELASPTPAAPRPPAMRAPSPASPALLGPRQATSAASAPTPAAGGSLEAETELLRTAQAELRQGRPGSALAALDAHGAKFKDGLLREERLAARILALCDLGRTSEARAEAQRFLAASPRSPMAERIRNACYGEASK
jgi:hypothetical protein